MPLPLLLDLPLDGPVEQVRLADVDGDGVDEAVVAARTGPGGALALHVVHLDGDALRDEVHPLPDAAAWWDAGHGLWLLDRAGLRRLDGPDGAAARLLAEATPLPGGPGAPGQAGLVTDLDGDGRPELLAWTRDRVEVVGTDGVRWGGVAATARATLERRQEAGGQVLAATLVPPPVATGDADGDGVLDLIVVLEDRLAVHRVRPGAVGAAEAWPLPAVLRPDSADRGAVTDARWVDLDRDGFVDLLVHKVRSDGRLAGTEAELHLLRGTGHGLGPPQVLATGAGSEAAFPVDVDGDGDLDVLVPRVSLDVGNLAQAVLTRSVDVSLVVHPLDQGRLGPALPLHAVPLPLEGGEAAWSMFGDHDGDGRVDLATALGGELAIHRGHGDAVEARPWVRLPLPGTVANLWAGDLTGDGVAELVGWSPGSRRLLVVRTR